VKAEQAHIMSVIQHPSVKSINDIKLTLHTTFNIRKGIFNTGITGCIVCPNGKIIVVDNSYNRRVATLNEDGTLYKEIFCSHYPFDVTCLDDATVAVSTMNGIGIVNIDSAETERFIKTSKPCRGITYHNGVLLWCEYERGIQMMQLSDDRVTTLVKQLKLYCSYITTCGDKIYQTNRDTNTVICYTIKGKKLWKYKDVSVLNDPRGVTVDNNSNVYVTSCSPHKVVVLEPHGRQGRQVISSYDGLADPNGIYFNKSKNSLFVANLGKAFLYNMC
jgi:DNA-binding beta-propeller fold protein YncE